MRARVAELAEVHQRKGHEMTGVELGYRYIGSPLIDYDPADADDDGFTYTYVPRAAAGYRLPHVWLADGTPLHDSIPTDRYTLIRLPSAEGNTAKLEQSLRDVGAPVDILTPEGEDLQPVLGTGFVLVRPDLHVAWRGTTPPADPLRFAALVTGHGRA